jgi:hypothetical protein
MRQKLGFAVIAVVVALSALGCASADRYMLDVGSLAGVWNGWIVGPNGKPEPAELTINPDGTYVSRMQGFSTSGVVRIEEQRMFAGTRTGTMGVAPTRRRTTMTLIERADAFVLSGYGLAVAGPFSFEVAKPK